MLENIIITSGRTNVGPSTLASRGGLRPLKDPPLLGLAPHVANCAAESLNRGGQREDKRVAPFLQLHGCKGLTMKTSMSDDEAGPSELMVADQGNTNLLGSRL